MPERGKFRKLFDSTELMCDAFLQSFLILVSSPLVSPPYPPVYTWARIKASYKLVTECCSQGVGISAWYSLLMKN